MSKAANKIRQIKNKHKTSISDYTIGIDWASIVPPVCEKNFYASDAIENMIAASLKTQSHGFSNFYDSHLIYKGPRRHGHTEAARSVLPNYFKSILYVFPNKKRLDTFLGRGGCVGTEVIIAREFHKINGYDFDCVVLCDAYDMRSLRDDMIKECELLWNVKAPGSPFVCLEIG